MMVGLTAAVLLAGVHADARATLADDKPAKACMVYYTGKVQGVGFRATTAEMARDFSVTGWVKNLADGRVQMAVEGSEQAVDKFLKAVRARWKENIEKEEIKAQEVSGKYKSFDVVK